MEYFRIEKHIVDATIDDIHPRETFDGAHVNHVVLVYHQVTTLN